MTIPIPNISALMLRQELYLRPHNRAATEAVRAALVEHHERDMPNHFTEFAGPKYGMAKRSDKYNAKKMRRKGHQRYLVFSGVLEASILGGRRITARPTGGRLIMQADLSGTVKNADQIKNARIGRVGIMRVKDAAARMRLGLGPMTRRQQQATNEALKRKAELEVDTAGERKHLIDVLQAEYRAGVAREIANGAKVRTQFRTI